MFSKTVLFVVVSLLVGVISEENFVTKNGLTFEVDDGFYSISSANIPTLQEGAIADIVDMKSLRLSFDNINTIELGAFENLPNLWKLVIQFNDIRRIEAGVFNNLKNLAHLDISFNKISIIASHAFDNMKNLEFINIAGNKLNQWDNLWFAKTQSLHSFFFSYNAFTEIPANAFGNQEKTGTYYFIDLDDNKINKIDTDAFKGFREITSLYVDLENESVLKSNFLRGIKIDALHIKVHGIRCFHHEISSEGFVAKSVTLNDRSTDIICKDRIDNVEIV